MATFVVGHDLQAGRLRSILGEYELLELSVYLVYPQRQHLAPKVRAFVDFMADRFAGTPYWDQSGAAGPAQAPATPEAAT